MRDRLDAWVCELLVKAIRTVDQEYAQLGQCSNSNQIALGAYVSLLLLMCTHVRHGVQAGSHSRLQFFRASASKLSRGQALRWTSLAH